MGSSRNETGPVRVFERSTWLAAPPADSKPADQSRQALPLSGNSDKEQLLRDVQHMTDEELQTFILKEMAKQ